MTRDVSNDVATNVAKPITRPVWLVEISYSTPLRITSGGIKTLGGLTFSYQGLEVHKCEEESAAFSVRNDNLAISALVSAEGANDIPCRIWKYYETDGVMLFAGFTDGCKMEKKLVRFDAVRVSAADSSFPNKIYHRDDFPYLPTPAGRRVNWNGMTFELQAKR